MRMGRSLFLLFFLAISVVVSTKVEASSTAEVYVEPASSYASVGESVTVDINVADVDNLHTWQVRIGFDPDVLEFVNFTEGDFLIDQPEGTWSTQKSNNTAGWALFAVYTQGQYAGVDGDGWLATVEFLTLTRGETILNITHPNTYLLEMASIAGGYLPKKIPCTLENGYFTSLVTPPVALFTHSPERPRKNEIVMFNASASDDEDGYIVSYEWDFGDETPSVAETDPITNHTYTTAGAKAVALNVTDDIGLWSIKTSEVWVKFARDVAVTNIDLSSTEVEVGETVSIDVTVTNLGEDAASFDVVVYFGATQLDTRAVTDLAPDAESTLSFSWDTEEVAPEDYTISAEADFEGDGHPDDNVTGAGTVTVNPAGAVFPTMLVIAVVVVVIVVVGAGAFLLMRRGGSSRS